MRKRGREVEKRRGGEEKRRGVSPWTVEWLCFLGPAVGDSSTVTVDVGRRRRRRDISCSNCLISSSR